MVSALPYIDRGNIFLVCGTDSGRCFSTVKLTDQDPRQPLMSRERHIVTDLGQSDKNTTVSDAYRVVYSDVRIKSDIY
jgi:hypothetical protein